MSIALPTVCSLRSPLRLFSGDLKEQVLLSVHLLGKPTAAQLHRLHANVVRHLQDMRAILASLARGNDAMLNCIRPVDVDDLFLTLPYVYLDTTKSRRYLETVRRQRYWAKEQRELSEYLAHLIGSIMRRICSEASAWFRLSSV